MNFEEAQIGRNHYVIYFKILPLTGNLDFTLKSRNKDNNLCLTKTPSNCFLGSIKATELSADIIIFIHNLVPSLF